MLKSMFCRANNLTKPAIYVLAALVLAVMMLPLLAQRAAAVEVGIWTSQDSGVNVNLYKPFFIDENEGWIVGDQGTILHTTDGGDNWTPQTSGTTAHLHNVHFIDADTGWACGASRTILHTDNGGETWTEQVSGGDAIVRDVFFLNATTGWAIGGKDLNGPAAEPFILHTTNGGVLWTSVDMPELQYCVVYTDADNGWSCGRSGTIHRTTNGGTATIDWVEQDHPYWEDTANVGLREMTLVDTNNIYAVEYNKRSADDSSIILHTSNGGTDWEARYLDGIKELISIAAVDADTAWAVGYDGVIVNTTNAGLTWDVQPCPTTNDFKGTFFLDDEHGWACGALGTIVNYHIIDAAIASSAFTASTTVADIGDTITFADESTGYELSYEWDFGDGTTSTEQNPTHQYADGGVYTVTLTTTNLVSTDEEEKADYIFVADEGLTAVAAGVAATVTGAEDRVEVAFVTGSLSDRVEVGIEYITEIPEAPAGYTSGSSLFEIEVNDEDGGSVIELGADATITVTYRGGDVAAANGDANLLELAYYDEVTEEWVRLTTTVDTTAMTLTAETDHLSTWAVLAAVSGGGGGCCASAAASAAEIASGWGLVGVLGLVGYCLYKKRDGESG